MSGELGRKVVKGMGWTFGCSVSVRLMQLVTTVLLARMLLPSQFGVFAIVNMLVTTVLVFRDLGFGEALLYYKTDLKRNSDTTFVMSVAFGAAVWAILYATAPFISVVFRNPELIWPLRLMGTVIMLSSFSLVPSALLERELEFRKRSLPELAMGLAYAVTSISLASAGFGIWSLISGHIVATLVYAVFAWRLSGWKAAISYDRKSARIVLAFGKPLMASSVMVLLFFYVDQAAIGRWLGTTALGCYSMAFTICHLPATNITSVVNRVMYPAYSKMNEDPQALRQAYMQAVRMVSLATIPIAIGMCVMSADIITGFLGNKWRPAVPLIHILAFYGLFRSIGSTAESMFKALGKTIFIYKTNCIQVLVALPLVYPIVIRYGASGVAVLFTLAYLVGGIYALTRVTRALKIPFSEFLKILCFPLLASTVAASLSLHTARLLLPAGTATAIGASTCMIALYSLAVFLFDKSSIQTIGWVLGSVKQS